MLKRLVEPFAYAVLASSLIVGAYQAGKLKERSWWRQELASRNEEVKATMARMGQEADNLDATVLRIVEGTRAKLEDAEHQISRLNARRPEELAKSFAVDPSSLCRPVPATCLQRRRPDGSLSTNGGAPGGAGAHGGPQTAALRPKGG